MFMTSLLRSVLVHRLSFVEYLLTAGICTLVNLSKLSLFVWQKLSQAKFDILMPVKKFLGHARLVMMQLRPMRCKNTETNKKVFHSESQKGT